MSLLAPLFRRMPARLLVTCLLAAAAAVLAPAGASAVPGGGYQAAATKELHRSGASAAAGQRRLPLHGPRVATASAARMGADLRSLAARREPATVLVSARSHAHVPALAAELRELGSGVTVVHSLGIVALRAHSPAEVVRRLGRDPRVAAIEPDRTFHISADPADGTDPSTGIPFGWAFDAVRAGQGLAAVGGGSSRVVAVIDTGVDAGHPDVGSQVVATFNSTNGSTDASDGVGHGTFVSGLISMDNDNGVGGRGVGGRTRIFGIAADDGEGAFSTRSLIVAKDVAIRRGADILNMSLGGTTLSEGESRTLEFAFLSDVLPIAASGNGAERGNPVEFPAAAVGGARGEVGIGLSVGAVDPGLQPASFSTHNAFVSVSAPGAGPRGCEDGVFSTVPANPNLIFDTGDPCAPVFTGFGAGRYGYSEGTSFATPIVSGVAAVAWQAQPRLASEQVADVVQRSARQTFGGPRWNEFTGTGVVDSQAAVAAARRYDVVAPRFRSRVRRARGRFRVEVFAGRDRADRGDRRAGGVRYALAERRRGGDDLRFLAGPSRRRIARTIRRRSGREYLAVACDANGNCASRRLRFPRR